MTTTAMPPLAFLLAEAIQAINSQVQTRGQASAYQAQQNRMRVLEVLEEHGPCTAKDVAMHTRLSEDCCRDYLMVLVEAKRATFLSTRPRQYLMVTK